MFLQQCLLLYAWLVEDAVTLSRNLSKWIIKAIINSLAKKYAENFSEGPNLHQKFFKLDNAKPSKKLCVGDIRDAGNVSNSRFIISFVGITRAKT